MGRAPAIIIIARHGARLDAEDREWSNRTDAPYNTPLSYGGWTQTRALGARVASLIHARDIALNNADVARAQKRKSFGGSESERPPKIRRRKHKVVLHSSPFLRCVQSSIAISAGIAQFQGNLAKLQPLIHKKPEPDQPRLFHPPSRSATLDTKSLEMQYSAKKAAEEAASIPHTHVQSDLQSDFQKVTLRIDACLGEWLSPEYFEFITPPPPSNMMVASAKADLIKPAEPLNGAKIIGHNGEPISPPHEQRKPPLSMHELEKALPQSISNGTESNARTSDKTSEQPDSPMGYIPPTPTYAVSTAGPIPGGFVAHARDACVNVDFQWDSMREPQSWGDGGVYGEEWSSMHRRFRGGIVNLVQWYKSINPDFDPQASTHNVNEHDDIDDDTDLVLVIVTHGAGCNALIGALTNQPVLMDVPMASLTMAVHKASPVVDSGAPSPTLEKIKPSKYPYARRRSSSVSTGLSEEYDMKLVASTDHLRAGSDPLKIPALQPPRSMATIPQSGDASPVSDGARTPLESDQPRSKNAALGSIRRTKSRATTTHLPQSATSYTASPTSPGGLWGPTNAGPGIVEQLNPVTVPTSVPEPTAESKPSTNGNAKHVNFLDGADVVPTPGVVRSNTGLWDATPRSEGRRRWTVNERR